AWEFPTIARPSQDLVGRSGAGADQPSTPAGAEGPEERMRNLEARLRVAERANRALLSEVARTQDELRSNTARQERRTRQAMEEAVMRAAAAVAANQGGGGNGGGGGGGGIDRLERQTMARIEALEAELSELTRGRAEQDRLTNRLAQENRVKRESAERGRLERQVTQLQQQQQQAAQTQSQKPSGAAGNGSILQDADLLLLQTRIQEAVELMNQRMLAKEARADKTDREVAALAQKLRNLPSSDSQQLQTMLEDYRRETMRRVTDTDERMQSLSTKLDKLTDKVDTNANLEKQKTDNLATLLRELTEKFDDSIKWQELVKGQITAVQNRQNATDD
uniref:Centrosomal protein of 162 kDa n=1 Tax=Macrostomum lignano TaxID=282301 RepID=A0A1I8HDA2_9PLAT